jgi:hypothetical protein
MTGTDAPLRESLDEKQERARGTMRPASRESAGVLAAPRPPCCLRRMW